MSVSIIMPYFKSELFLEKTIKSVLNQSFTDWELIIIDDENSSNSKKFLIKYKRLKKIRIYHNNVTVGAGLSRNIGIKKAKKKFIAFIDSDDLWKKNKLYLQIQAMKKQNLDFSFTAFECINEKGAKLYKVKADDELNYKKLLSACNIACSSVLIKKKIFNKVSFDNLKTKEDYNLWLKISRLGYKIGGINKILTSYLSRSSSLSSNHLDKLKNAFLIYHRENNFNILISFFFVIRLYFNAFKKKYFN